MKTTNDHIARSGVDGLDDVLGGGFTRRRLYLVEGVPGSGKTTMALQFLLEGAREGEPVLYVSLSESEEEVREIAESHAWNLKGITIKEVIPTAQALQGDNQYTMFHPSEVELSETTKVILDDVARIKPRRIVFDSLSEFRLLSGSALQFRRQILALKQFFAGQECTVLLLDDLTATDRDLQVQSIAHGVVLLEQLNPDFGRDRRRMRVIKYRGREFRGGYHDYMIRRGGIQIYPRLVSAEHRSRRQRELFPSGIQELDALLGGGLDSGSSTLIVGAAGTGKSTFAAQFASTLAAQGKRSAFFIFDESIDSLLIRCEALGIDLEKWIDEGMISIQPIDPAELSPGEFIHLIREAVQEGDASMIVIDSLNGYLNAMPEERFLTIQLHELLSYLSYCGVATLLIGAQLGLIGGKMNSPVEASYLADSVIVMRYFEARGEVRQVISVMKRRGGVHERTIREYFMTKDGISIGEPIRNFRGVLSGAPSHENASDYDT